MLSAAPSEFLRRPSFGLLRVIDKIKSLQELTASKRLCCRAEYAARRGSATQGRAAGCGSASSPKPTIAICDSDPYRGRVPLGMWSALYVGKGTLITAAARGVSDSHLQPAIADGAAGAERSASPRRTWGGCVPTAGTAVPGSSPLASLSRAAKQSRQLSLLGHKWAVLALGSWSTNVTDD